MPAPWGGTDAPPATGGGAAEPRQVEADLDQPEAADERPVQLLCARSSRTVAIDV